jgi:hypothetical protein
MERIELRKTDRTVEILGFPEAVKAIRLTDAKSRRLADLFLHKGDLEFAAECLRLINEVPPEPPVVREALWRAAVIHYMKCFGGSESRGRLNEKTLYRGQPAEALECFQFFESLRNKHFVHDDNPYTDCVPTAVLNKSDAPHKIAKIVCIALRATTLTQEHYSNLSLLINVAHTSVTRQFDELANSITRDLEPQDYETLAARDSANLATLKNADVHRTRRDE